MTTVKQRVCHHVESAKKSSVTNLLAKLVCYTRHEYRLDKEDLKIKALCQYERYIEIGGDPSKIKDFFRIQELLTTYNKEDWDRDLETTPVVTVDYNEVDSIDYITAQRYLRLAQRCAEKGVSFDLSLNDIKSMIKRRRCEYSGELISLDLPSDHPNKLTFDRVNNKLGYVKGNVAVVAHWVNQMKSVMFETDSAPFHLDNFGKVLKIMNNIDNKLKNTHNKIK